MATPKYFVPMNSIHATVSGRTGQIGKITSEAKMYYAVQFDNAEPEVWYFDEGNTANTKREAETLAKEANS